MSWPNAPDALVAWQLELAAAAPPPWRAPAAAVGGCWVCFPRGESGAGAAGDPAWAAACVQVGGQTVATAEHAGAAGAPYVAGLLALREGPLLEAAVRSLGRRPDVLLVNAGGRDHPRRAGLATALGAVLDLPTVGVTHRPLVAAGSWPPDRRGASAPLRIGDEVVGSWLRVRAGARPLAVHPAWRTDVAAAEAVVLACTSAARTPGPLREARRLARVARGRPRCQDSGMDIAIAGGHGQIARRLTRALVARGDRVRGLIRNPEHADDLRADGAEPVAYDLEAGGVDELAVAIAGADAVVFAAGAGPGSGAERKWTMDRDGAVKLVEAARAQGIDRYVIVSSIGAEDPPPGDDVFSIYLRAKAEADRALMDSALQWTVVRPGALRDDPGAGRVRISTDPFRNEVARDDVAAVLAAVLHEPRSVHRVLYVGSGDDPIDDALVAASS